MAHGKLIVRDPKILCGKPTVRGTRISVELILELFANGWTQEEVLDNYPDLTPKSLRAAFAYAAEALARETKAPIRRRA
jgi:uncharacterized protein (DUF433 family)